MSRDDRDYSRSPGAGTVGALREHGLLAGPTGTVDPGRDRQGRFLPGHNAGNTLRTPEAKARQAAGNDSAKGRKGKAASPWGRFAHCASPRAQLARMRYAKGKPCRPT
jgi:hypothetical protein